MTEQNETKEATTLLRQKLKEADNPTSEEVEYRKRQIGHAKATLSAILSELESFSLPAIQETTTSPKVFIAHGGETKAISKLRDFLTALGIILLVAEKEPSEGRSVGEQVEWCLDNSDCAIILGTSDDKNLKDGKLYPRPNVCIEIGRVQERFPGKVIYLLEEGASFPSNITEKIYERFTQDNMEKAFLKTAKELKAFGITKATAIRRRDV
jgi:predicted nucleotide-binding protein